ncbi:TolC family protein [Desulfurivibrio dismutans]|uniref:TolC family protein n=1 Tax=Desulfurivibrio dismutans TaxID=1398908 RepID=UPI0023DAAE49|nr:TolC family protein [Desulfurivibrio alkaliphilus]MDF1613865.1 TolC family protein [Desulfurivibrio alkaliphilus]
MRTKEPHRKSYWAALLVVLLAGLAVAALPAGVVASEAGELPPDLVMPETPEAAASAREAATAARRLDLERYLPRSAADQFPRPDEQGRLELSVEEAVVMALANNRSLGIQLYRPLISGTFAEQERAVFDPTLFAEASAGREKIPFGDDYRRTETENYRLGVEQELATGTALELALEQRRSDAENTPDGLHHRAGASLSLTQALLRGGSREANLVGVRQADLEVLVSLYELRGFTQSLVAEVERAYWELVLAESRIAIYRQSLAVAQSQLQDVLRRIEVGTVAAVERAAAEAELAFRRQSLIDGESSRDQARLELLNLVNPAPAGSTAGMAQQRRYAEMAEIWTLQPVPRETPYVPQTAPDPVLEHVALSRQMRPDLGEARLRLEQGELEVVQTRNGLLPRLDLFITLGKTGYADSFGRSFRELIDDSTYAGSAGLRFSLPLRGNRAAAAVDARARASRNQAEASLGNLSQLVELDVRKAHLEAHRTRTQIDASAERRRLQEEVLRVEEVKFEVGRSTALNVARAQRDLLESQLAEVDAKVAYRLALTELYRLDGSLLARRQITTR